MAITSSEPRQVVHHWLEQYQQRAGVGPADVETLRAELTGMNERQLERFADWLRRRGAFEMHDEPEASPSAWRVRGFGLPGWPRRGRPLQVGAPRLRRRAG